MYPHRNVTPRLGRRVFIAPSAVLTGRVQIGDDVSLWFHTVARGDIEPIRIGRRTNVQDGAVLHTSKDYPLNIGRNVVIGHGAVIHGCTLEEGCLIGMGAKVLDGAVVQAGAQVAAGAVVPPGLKVESGHLYVGVPARKVRELTDQETAAIRDNASRYVALKNEYIDALGGG